MLDRYQGEEYPWLSADLMKLLQEKRLGHSAKYANLAEKAANLAETAHDWRRARIHWQIKAKWHQLEKDGEQERKAAMRAAETFVQEAEDVRQQDTLPDSRASDYLRFAIEAFRRIRGTKEETAAAKSRAEELHKRLLQYQQEIPKEGIPIVQTFDSRNESKRARDYVSGKGFLEAIRALVEIEVQPKLSHLQQDVGTDPLSPFMPIVKMNRMGKVVARQPDDPDRAEAATHFAMYQEAVFYQKQHAEIYLEPAIDQINREHSICIKDFHDFVSCSIFVPPDREYVFAKGLYAGFTGDLLTAAHLLIPQIENSIRELCKRMSVRTSGLDSKGIQEEYDLNRLLDSERFPEITSMFDEDMLFNLRGLLVQRSGSNLRNRIAHGLINDDEFCDSLMSYLWWLVLRLCWLPILRYEQLLHYQQQQEQEEKEPPKESNPWIVSAGTFGEDPLLEEMFQEEMAAYRREVDDEMEAIERATQEVVSGESQSK